MPCRPWNIGSACERCCCLRSCSSNQPLIFLTAQPCFWAPAVGASTHVSFRKPSLPGHVKQACPSMCILIDYAIVLPVISCNPHRICVLFRSSSVTKAFAAPKFTHAWTSSIWRKSTTKPIHGPRKTTTRSAKQPRLSRAPPAIPPDSSASATNNYPPPDRADQRSRCTKAAPWVPRFHGQFVPIAGYPSQTPARLPAAAEHVPSESSLPAHWLRAQPPD